MNKSPDYRALRWLLGAGFIVVAPHVLVLPTWVILSYVSAALWCLLLHRYHWRHPGRVLRLILALAAVAAVYRAFGTVLGRDPGLALLIVLAGLKLLELRAQRDAVLVALLHFIVLVGGFLYEQALWLGVYAMGAVVANCAALIRLNHPSGITNRDVVKLAAGLVVKAVPLMIVLYLLFPRIQGTLWGIPADAYSGLTGMPEVMRPGNIHRLSESSEPAFRVHFDGAQPPANLLYWRGQALWQTDGRTWRAGTERSDWVDSFTPVGENPVSYRVTLEPSNMRWLFALDLPASIPDGARARPGFVRERATPIRDRYGYHLISYLRYRTGALSDNERRYALQIPEKISPRVSALAAGWRDVSVQPTEIVQAALRFFHEENFVYTLEPPLLGADPVDEFLFNTRRGFCEHYAAAFVTLMRAAGIPSRVVIGYLGGDFNQSGGYLLVRQADAHAWAEVWLEGQGWTRVDPTAAVAPERVELGIDMLRRMAARGMEPGSLTTIELAKAFELNWFTHAWRRARQSWDYVNISWYFWVVDYTSQRQNEFFAMFGLNRLSWIWVALVTAAIVLLTLLCYGVALWRQTPVRDPVQRLYRRFCRKLARAGLARAPHEGPLNFAQRAITHRPDLRSPIGTITRLYLELRYGQRTSSARLASLSRAVTYFKTRRA
jgi:transglutaminase-like putative cysteine protease